MKNITNLLVLFFLAIGISEAGFNPLQTAPATGIVGDVRVSFLTEAQFQARAGGGWVLADGRDVTGSSYHSITGNTLAPDTRGRALRGKDNGASVNPDGELLLGTNQNDAFNSHNHGGGSHNHGGGNHAHTATLYFYDAGSPRPYFRASYGATSQGTSVPTHNSGTIISTQANISAEGLNETRMKNVTVNYFIRIN